jgi:hypothetical protein
MRAGGRIRPNSPFRWPQADENLVTALASYNTSTTVHSARHAFIPACSPRNASRRLGIVPCQNVCHAKPCDIQWPMFPDTLPVRPQLVDLALFILFFTTQVPRYKLNDSHYSRIYDKTYYAVQQGVGLTESATLAAERGSPERCCRQYMTALSNVEHAVFSSLVPHAAVSAAFESTRDSCHDAILTRQDKFLCRHSNSPKKFASCFYTTHL